MRQKSAAQSSCAWFLTKSLFRVSVMLSRDACAGLTTGSSE
eukprot:CAMPEP_0114642792 /NCGR_PEP_ID=MMETSP0191-20121206/3018_1 /TAXON_ID=126664 /ORGANISM="Sorites sp." /LENGTH=40 /DNA_ID= /DNA_START= /DNA_END= /DNA_ORIENTATION=